MLTAFCDQNEGVSMSSCSKITSPLSDVIAAVRSCHSIWA